MIGILIKFNIYLGIRELGISESNELIYSTINQYFEDRTFELYLHSKRFAETSYIDYKNSFSKGKTKEVDVEKVRKATNRALNAFKNSYGKEV